MGQAGLPFLLKTREYLAKGLPIIAGSKVDLFINQKFDYLLEFPNDDSCIQVEQIIEFFDSIYNRSFEEINSQIRQYAEERCDMSSVLKPIVEFIKSRKEV